MTFCPKCKKGKLITVDSRQMDDLDRIWRVKICVVCSAHFRSLEKFVECKTKWKLPKRWISTRITKK